MKFRFTLWGQKHFKISIEFSQQLLFQKKNLKLFNALISKYNSRKDVVKLQFVALLEIQMQLHNKFDPIELVPFIRFF